jgi:hypothetical protein
MLTKTPSQAMPTVVAGLFLLLITMNTAAAQTIYEPYAITTLAGLAGVQGSADGSGSEARFARPTGVAFDSTGNPFFANALGPTIRKIIHRDR